MDQRKRERQDKGGLDENRKKKLVVNGSDFGIEGITPVLRENNNLVFKVRDNVDGSQCVVDKDDDKTKKFVPNGNQNPSKNNSEKEGYPSKRVTLKSQIKQQQEKLTIGDQLIKVVNEFVYLGQTFCSDGSIDRKIEKRVNANTKIIGIICTVNKNEKLSMSAKKVRSPVFKSLSVSNKVPLKLEFLDLSMAAISSQDLAKLLNVCRRLGKLSLEHCTVDEMVCESISQNAKLQTLNLGQCYQLNAEGLKRIVDNCVQLQELNVQWTGIDGDAVKVICERVSPQLQALSLSGNKHLTDELVDTLLDRCGHLQQLDFSDCALITRKTADSLMDKAPELKMLSLSRCYRILPACYANVMKHPKLDSLNVFGLLEDTQLNYLAAMCESRIELNKMKFTPIARPTVGVRRTSIWGQRVRD